MNTSPSFTSVASHLPSGSLTSLRRFLPYQLHAIPKTAGLGSLTYGSSLGSSLIPSLLQRQSFSSSSHLSPFSRAPRVTVVDIAAAAGRGSGRTSGVRSGRGGGRGGSNAGRGSSNAGRGSRPSLRDDAAPVESTPAVTFEQIGLSEALQAAVKGMGIETPSEIQVRPCQHTPAMCTLGMHACTW